MTMFYRTDDPAQTVEAERYDGEVIPSIIANGSGATSFGAGSSVSVCVGIQGPDDPDVRYATVPMASGDWAVRDAAGQIRVMPADQFEATYEQAEPQTVT